MPVVKTTNLFSNNEQITSAKLNNIMVNSSFDSGAVVSGQGLEITVGGQMQIKDLDVTTAKIADSNVTTAKIADANVTPAKLSQPLTSAIAQNSTSGTRIDFTGIPSWVKRITVMFDKVSANGTSPFLIQLGDSGGFETSGYESFLTLAASTVTTHSATAGFRSGGGIAARDWRGMIQVCLLSGNTWVASGTLNDLVGNNAFVSGSKTLSDTLTQVRFTTVNGTDTFDAGSVNIMYE